MYNKCQHFNVCITMTDSKSELLCNDSKCKLNRLKHLESEQQGIDGVVEELTKIKRQLGIKSFLDLNNK